MVKGCKLMFKCYEIRVKGLRFFWFKVYVRVMSLKVMVEDLNFRFFCQSSEFRVCELGFRVQGAKCKNQG